MGSDSTYPVWRAGANTATALHTDADLDLGGLAVPKGDYSLYINVANPASWELIVKPPSMLEQLKYTLSTTGGNKGKLQLAWENVVASVNFTVK